ncbi:MAG: SIS domain-containing protein [Abditibacteriota bacterium]|nr:SIS domain-containing protein [Abditibacteriota bacterium]
MKKPFENYPDMAYLAPVLEEAVEAAFRCVSAGGKIMVCGSGGSAADSEHIAGELLKGFLKKRPVGPALRSRLEEAGAGALADRLQLGIPCISLVSHSALLTAVINDNGADMMFAQQVCAFGREGDMLIAISTSGNAENAANAAICANAMGITTLGMTGEGGGRLGKLCRLLLAVPSRQTYRVQEYHIALYHYFCGALEEKMFEE